MKCKKMQGLVRSTQFLGTFLRNYFKFAERFDNLFANFDTISVIAFQWYLR